MSSNKTGLIGRYGARISLCIFYGLLAYMPLHILLSTWLGTSFNILEPLKVAKDVVLLVGFLLALFASLRMSWFPRLLLSPLIGLIVAYGIFTVATALTHAVQQDAELLGVVYNLRFLLFFLYAVLLACLYDVRRLLVCSVKIVLVVGVCVALFGAIQYVALPDDALTHLGYSRENGVLPAFFIDDKPDFERAMATLRDPNSLGSYLIIVASLLCAAIATTWRRNSTLLKSLSLVSLAIVLACLVFTFSRSAWLGALVAGLVYLAPAAVSFVRRNAHGMQLQTIISTLLVAGSLLITTGLAVKDSYVVQNVVFHADSSTTLEDPNELRLRFWSEALDAAKQAPFGHGVGTAGLASIRNVEQGTVLTENYYLQLLYEVGVVGLVLFLAILVLVAWHLYQAYRAHQNLYALALLASFAGLLITNFLVHIWANEAVAYTFWGLVGLLLASQLVSKAE